MEASNIEQGTYEWHMQRCCRFTASEIWRLMGEAKREMTETELKAWKEANPKSTAKLCVDPKLLTDGAMTYVLEVASERETGKPAKIMFENESTKWGHEHEPIAKLLYAEVFDVTIQDGVFFPYKDFAGASPDGLISTGQGLEIKCPITQATHMKYRTLESYKDLKENHPDHYWQCVMGMLCTGRKEWVFVSYHPHFKAVKQLKTLLVPWVQADIDLLVAKLEAAEKACNYLTSIK